MTSLPKDPFILLSYINTKLRDNFSSLEALCDDFNVIQKELEDRLQSIDYVYIKEQNQFLPFQ